MLDLLLALLYPPRCPLCRRELHRVRPGRFCRACSRRLAAPAAGCPRCADPGGTALCARCRITPPAFARARAALAYRSHPEDCAARTAIARWKYAGDLPLGAALAARFATWGCTLPRDFDVVVPVPLDRRRLAVRGFNQAAVLARAVAEKCDRAMMPALGRERFEHSQTALGRAGRRHNVSGRFYARRPTVVAGRRALLVDDVLTSGATADECARTLLAAGATRVEVWTLARAGASVSSS